MNDAPKTEKELKQVNFRLNPETANAFREFCNLNGMNQAQGFDHIMQVLELNNAKSSLPGRSVEIEEFERYTKAILSAYLHSLELCDNAEARILERFQLDVQRNTKTIDELRNTNEQYKAELQQIQENREFLKQENNSLKEKIAYSDQALEEQRQSLELIREQFAQAQARLIEQDKYEEQIQTLENEKRTLHEKCTTLSGQINPLERELQRTKTEQVQTQQSLAEAEDTIRTLEDQVALLQKTNAELNNQLKESAYTMAAERKQMTTQAELNLERAIAAKEKEMQDIVQAAKQEAMKLSVELEYLKKSHK